LYYTYILESQSNGMLYIGSTANLIDRLHRHNAGRVKSTKSLKPWKVIGKIELNTRAEAVQLERKLKNWKNPQKVKEFLKRAVD